jgi:hypothetical protein
MSVSELETCARRQGPKTLPLVGGGQCKKMSFLVKLIAFQPKTATLMV